MEPAKGAEAWTPTLEQKELLEYLFNAGMVDPANADVARLCELLNQRGAAVDGDDVCCWFQSQRFLRILQAAQAQSLTSPVAECGASAGSFEVGGGSGQSAVAPHQLSHSLEPGSNKVASEKQQDGGATGVPKNNARDEVTKAAVGGAAKGLLQSLFDFILSSVKDCYSSC